MSQRVVGYEGEGRHRKPIYAPEGPATASASSPMAMLGRLALPGMSSPTGGAGPIERRFVAAAVSEARQADRPALNSPEHVQQSRLNGARRHVEVLAERRALEEEQAVTDPNIEDRPDAGPAQAATREIRPLHELADAAERAAAAWDRLEQHDRQRVVLVSEWTRSREALAEWWEESGLLLARVVQHDEARSWMVTNAHDVPILATTGEESLVELVVDPEQVQAEVDAAWAERQAAEAPAPEAGGGPGTLTAHEQRVLASAIKHRGDRKAVAQELSFNHVESVDGALEKVGKKGALPIALIPLLPARFAKYQGA